MQQYQNDILSSLYAYTLFLYSLQKIMLENNFVLSQYIRKYKAVLETEMCTI